jgi:hypothetical protein
VLRKPFSLSDLATVMRLHRSCALVCWCVCFVCLFLAEPFVRWLGCSLGCTR